MNWRSSARCNMSELLCAIVVIYIYMYMYICWWLVCLALDWLLCTWKTLEKRSSVGSVRRDISRRTAQLALALSHSVRQGSEYGMLEIAIPHKLWLNSVNIVVLNYSRRYCSFSPYQYRTTSHILPSLCVWLRIL